MNEAWHKLVARLLQSDELKVCGLVAESFNSTYNFGPLAWIGSGLIDYYIIANHEDCHFGICSQS